MGNTISDNEQINREVKKLDSTVIGLRPTNDSNHSSGVSDSTTQSRPKSSARIVPSPLRQAKMAQGGVRVRRGLRLAER